MSQKEQGLAKAIDQRMQETYSSLYNLQKVLKEAGDTNTVNLIRPQTLVSYVGGSMMQYFRTLKLLFDFIGERPDIDTIGDKLAEEWTDMLVEGQPETEVAEIIGQISQWVKENGKVCLWDSEADLIRETCGADPNYRAFMSGEQKHYRDLVQRYDPEFFYRSRLQNCPGSFREACSRTIKERRRR